MFGNLMSNALITRAVKERRLAIQPFEKPNLKLAQYTVYPLEIVYEDDEEGAHRHDLSRPYHFGPMEYTLVVVKHRIIIQDDAIVARFIPASGLIERGFNLLCGKLDPHYGENGEQIRFGLQNVRQRQNVFSNAHPVAHVEFFDLRGLPADKVQLNEYDEQIRGIRDPERLERFEFGDLD